MTLLLLFSGADFVAAPVIPDAAGFAFLEEIQMYGAQLEEIPIYGSQSEELTIYGTNLSEER
jgi:hypothetical protein